MKKALFFLAIIIGVFGIGNNIKALYIQVRTNDLSATTTPNASVNIWQTLGTNLNGSVSSIDLWYKILDGAGGNWRLILKEYSSSTYYNGSQSLICWKSDYINFDGSSSEATIRNIPITSRWEHSSADCSAGTETTVSEAILDPSKYYAFFWGYQYGTNATNVIMYGSTATTDYPYGDLSYSVSDISPLKELWFKINSAYRGSEPTSSFGFFYDETNFSTQNPLGCQYTQVATSSASEINVDVSFQFTNAPDSNTNYNNIYIKFYNSDGNASTVVASTNNWEPNSAFSYAETITLPATSYRIEYHAEGYDISTGEYKEIVSAGTDLNGNICTFSGVGYEAVAPNNINNWGNAGYLACQNYTDNCIGTSTSWTDSLICRVEGFFVGIICPSNESYGKAKNILNDARGRFPFSYINVAKTSFTTFSSSSVATTSATTTYIQGDLSFFSKIKEITVVGYIRTVFGYLIMAFGSFYIIKTGFNKILK